MSEKATTSWPSLQDFNEAIQTPQLTIQDRDLKVAQPHTDNFGIPIPSSGNFAAVYKLESPTTKRNWAVKCFRNPIDQRRERYHEISEYLKYANLPYTIDFKYIAEGIRVGAGLYPILKMEWVEGILLHRWVSEYVNDAATLEQLFDEWLQLASALKEAGLAHGDLQHGNVIVRRPASDDVALTLIDYDGLFVPALAMSPPTELGHPAYQHPRRLTQKTFNADIDRFPILVVACALRALSVHGSELWFRYNNTDNLLFLEPDLAVPSESELLRQLWNSKDALTRNLAGHLIYATDLEIGKEPFLPELLQERPDAALLPTEKQVVEAILRRKTPPKPEPVSCPECGSQIPTGEFQSHVRKCHSERTTRASRVDSPATSTPFPPTEPASQAVHGQWQLSRTHLIAISVVVVAVVIATSLSHIQSMLQRIAPTWSIHEVAPELPPVEVITPVEAEMVLIPAGEFMMGTDVHIPQGTVRIGSLDGDNAETPVHLVTIGQEFELGNYAVTQSEWARVMKSKPWQGQQYVREGDRFPATYVSWLGAVKFCNELSRSEGLPEYYSIANEEVVTIPDLLGDGYRLPTEAEWEYACRGGTTTPWSFRNDERPGDFAWFGELTPEGIARISGFSGETTTQNATLWKKPESTDDGQLTPGTELFAKEVGRKKSNPFGLYDMHGNVEQWCWDWYDEYLPGPAKNPNGPSQGRNRVTRGGRWDWYLAITRSAYRSMAPPSYQGASTGFRVARTLGTAKRSMPQVVASVNSSAPSLTFQSVTRTPVSVEMKLIPAGEFRMGSPMTIAASSPKVGRVVFEDAHRSENEGPQHVVEITSSFYLGVYEVTHEQYFQVMGKNPSKFSSQGRAAFRVDGKNTQKYPIESVSWFDAIDFCNRLSQRNGHVAYYQLDHVERAEGSIVSATVTSVGGQGFRLPSEAEWEYACRANTRTPYHCGIELNFDTANFEGNSPYGTYSYRKSAKGKYFGRPTTVGSYPPNAFGLHDMHGNVYEWCWDWADDSYYSTFKSSIAVDPIGPVLGTDRIARGGGFDSSAQATRSAYRGHARPGISEESIGFRIARTP